VEKKYGKIISTKSIYNRMKATEEVLGDFMKDGNLEM
jgi:hypothetical protein